MPINTIVREKRKELGLTQEQVADYLGVSTPAVNKWEKGSSYPDVTILPALARLLKTDLNTLLCFHEELSKKEIGLFLNRIHEIFLQDGFEIGFATAMEKIHEYPANSELLCSLALVMHGSLVTSNVSLEQKEGYDNQITQLYEQVAKCNEPVYSERANYMLAGRLIAAQKYDEAQETLNMLPEYSALDKRNLQAQLWLSEEKTEKAAELLEHKLLSSLQEVQAALVSLARIAVNEGDEKLALHLAQCGIKEVELFGLWGYSAFLAPLEAAISRKNVKDSISILQDMLAELLIPWDMTKSPICKHIQKKPAEKNFGLQFLPSVLFELENSTVYDFLRDEPLFKQLISSYRLKC